MRHWVGLLIAIVLAAVGAPPAGAEVYQSVHVDGAAPLVYDADPRLHLRTETTLEVVFTLPSPPTDDRTAPVASTDAPSDSSAPTAGPPVPVVSLIGRGGLTLWVSGDHQRLGVTALGAPPEELPHTADLGDGQPHQVAVILRAGAVDLRVDGGELQGTTFITPEAPSPEGLGLAFGSAGDTSPFRGWIRSFRLWHDVLSAEELNALREERGWPAPSEVYDRDTLAAYGHFTDQRQVLFHTRAPLRFASVSTGAPGDDFFVPFGSGGQTLSRRVFGLFSLAPDAHLDELQLVLGAFEDDPDQQLRRLPFVLPLNPGRPPLEIARYWTDLRVRMENGDEPDGQEEQQTFFRTMIAGLDEFGLEDTEEWKGEWVREPGLDLGAIVGTHDGVHLTSVAFNDRAGESVAHFGRSEVWHQAFFLALPQESNVAGITLRRGTEGLTGIGLAWSEGEQDHADEQLARMVGQRLIAEGARPPVRLDVDPEQPDHGSFTHQTVFVLRRIPGAEGVALLADRGVDPIQAQHFVLASDGVTYEQADLPEALAVWTEQELVLSRKNKLMGQRERFKALEAASRPYQRMAIVGDRVQLFDREGGGPDLFLRPPRPYDDGGTDKLPWGATFSLEQRATRTRANFVGYDLLTMDSRDYQANIGRHEQVFAYPSEDSRAYRTSDSKIIFPDGLLLDSDAQGSEHSKADVVKSREEYAAYWSQQVGKSIGIPEVASFSANQKHANETGVAAWSNARVAIATTRVNHYGLVADQARMELSPGFRAAVDDLRNRLRAGLLPEEDDARAKVLENYGSGTYEAGRLLLPHEEIVEQHGFSSSAAETYAEVNRLAAELKLHEQRLLQRFGTHFPYAVTYGGLLHYLEKEGGFGQSKSSKSDEELRRDAKLTLSNLAIGVDDDRSSGGSRAIEGELGSDRSSYGSYGGTLSSNGGWSLGRGEEVPILLDLRPIHRLLSPIHFDDIAIWTELRHRVYVLMRLYVDRVERAGREEVSYQQRERRTLETKAQLFCGVRATPESCAAQGWRQR